MWRWYRPGCQRLEVRQQHLVQLRGHKPRQGVNVHPPSGLCSRCVAPPRLDPLYTQVLVPGQLLDGRLSGDGIYFVLVPLTTSGGRLQNIHPVFYCCIQHLAIIKWGIATAPTASTARCMWSCTHGPHRSSKGIFVESGSSSPLGGARCKRTTVGFAFGRFLQA